MKIDQYNFGNITIDGKKYTSDVIIYPRSVDASWWRTEGHNLDIDDLKSVVSAKPQKLVIGTGYYGQMRVPEKTLKHLAAHGIEAHVAKTGEAVELFNQLQREAAAVVAALHLTC